MKSILIATLFRAQFYVITAANFFIHCVCMLAKLSTCEIKKTMNTWQTSLTYPFSIIYPCLKFSLTYISYRTSICD